MDSYAFHLGVWKVNNCQNNGKVSQTITMISISLLKNLPALRIETISVFLDFVHCLVLKQPDNSVLQAVCLFRPRVGVGGGGDTHSVGSLRNIQPQSLVHCLRMERDPVFKALNYLVFRILGNGQSPKT